MPQVKTHIVRDQTPDQTLDHFQRIHQEISSRLSQCLITYRNNYSPEASSRLKK